MQFDNIDKGVFEVSYSEIEKMNQNGYQNGGVADKK